VAAARGALSAAVRYAASAQLHADAGSTPTVGAGGSVARRFARPDSEPDAVQPGAGAAHPSARAGYRRKRAAERAEPDDASDGARFDVEPVPRAARRTGEAPVARARRSRDGLQRAAPARRRPGGARGAEPGH